jgi:hypothetical protein
VFLLGVNDWYALDGPPAGVIPVYILHFKNFKHRLLFYDQQIKFTPGNQFFFAKPKNEQESEDQQLAAKVQQRISGEPTQIH